MKKVIAELVDGEDPNVDVSPTKSRSKRALMKINVEESSLRRNNWKYLRVFPHNHLDIGGNRFDHHCDIRYDKL